MPPMKSQSPIAAKIGAKLRAAHEAHKNDDTSASSGGGDLPPLDNGVAQLKEVKLTQIKPGKQNAGEYMFYAAGIVIVPKSVNGIPVAGRRTQISEPLFDTPTRTRKTVDDHVAHIYAILRDLGVDTTTIDPNNIEATFEALKAAAPYFAFRTWKGEMQKTGPYANKEPRVNHDWMGIIPDFQPSDDSADAFTDNSGGTDTDVNENAEDAADTTDAEPTTEEATTDSNEPDLEAMAAAADGGDGEMAAQLKEMAMNAGYSEAEVDDVTSWALTVEMINNPKTAEEEAPAEEEFMPAKGETYRYAPINPKTKKPDINPKTKKPKTVEVEVVAVDAAKKLVGLKNLEDKKTAYKAVPFTDLLSAD